MPNLKKRRLANRAAAVLGKGGMAPGVTPAAAPPSPAMAPIPAAAPAMPGAVIPAAGAGEIKLAPAPRGVQDAGAGAGGIRARGTQPQAAMQNLMRQRGGMSGVMSKRRRPKTRAGGGRVYAG